MLTNLSLYILRHSHSDQSKNSYSKNAEQRRCNEYKKRSVQRAASDYAGRDD